MQPQIVKNWQKVIFKILWIVVFVFVGLFVYTQKTFATPSCSFSFSPQTIVSGEYAVSTWSSSGATGLTYECSNYTCDAQTSTCEYDGIGNSGTAVLNGTSTTIWNNHGVDSVSNCTFTATDWIETTTCSDALMVITEVKPPVDITCGWPFEANKEFTCEAKCEDLPISVDWWPTSNCSLSGNSTVCSFDSGSYSITATPDANAVCSLGNVAIIVGDAIPAEVTCVDTQYPGEAFSCSVTCEGKVVDANWSLTDPSAGSCSPVNGSTTQCTLVKDATINATLAGNCSVWFQTAILEYRDLTLTCNPLTMRSGEVLTCTAQGGKSDYTWSYPRIITVDPASTNSTQILGLNITDVLDMPNNGEITISMQDLIGTTKTATIQVIAPPLVINEIYTVGSPNVAKGVHQDVYVRVTAPSGNETIASLEIKLLKGAYSVSNLPPVDVQVFNVLDTNASIETMESSQLIESGATTLFTTLYKIPVFIPDYAELTNGTYTFQVTAFDTNLQQTVAYLQTTIGPLTNGDINGDLSLDIVDIVKVVAFFLNPDVTQPTLAEIQSVDFNNNQQIDLADVVKVIQEAMKD